MQPASPTPTPARAATSWMKFCARPQTPVKALQAVRQPAMIQARLYLSAARASGKPSRA